MERTNKNKKCFKKYIGKKLGVNVTTEEIIHCTHASTCRVICPGMMVTMDYRPDRVNVRVNNSNVILSIYMG